MSKPTGLARELGANLRFQREQAEWSEKRVAEFLDISQGQLCRIEQGYLEGCGVEPARAMVDMIVSLRAYEATQRVLHAIDDTLGRATSQVGTING